MTNPITTYTPIHITAHNLDLSLPLREFVRKKIGTVARFANDVIAMDIVLRRDLGLGNERFSASARLALPGRDVHSGASTDDLYTAIGIVAERLARRLRKRKTRLSKTYSVRSNSRATITGAEESALSATSEGNVRNGSLRAPLAATQSHETLPREPRTFVFRRRAPLTFTPVNGLGQL